MEINNQNRQNEPLLRLNPHTHIASLSEHLPSSKQLNFYILSCKVDNKSARTTEKYQDVLEKFFDLLGSGISGVEDITSHHVREYLLYIQTKGLKPSSVQTHYRALHSFFEWCIRENFIDKSPMQNMKPPKIPKEIIKPFSKADIHRMLVCLNGNRLTDLRDRAMIMTFLDTGLRLEEMTSIQMQDIKLEEGVIKVMGKGGKERKVRVGKETHKALLKYLIAREDELSCLWVAAGCRPMKREAIKTMIQRLTKRAGIEGVRCSPHTFRHTFATMWLRNGGGEFMLQSMLGHSTLSMTRRYVASINSDDAIKAHEKYSPMDNL